MFKIISYATLFAFFFTFETHAYAENFSPEAISEVVGDCQISITETEHLKLGKIFKNIGEGISPAYCHFYFTTKDHIGLTPIDLTISDKKDINNCNCAAGFVLDHTKKWHFEGNNSLLDSRFLKRTFKQEERGDDTILIGTQLLRGNIAQGGPMDVPGISIVRITPQFVLSIELNFEPTYYEKQNKGYKELREAVSNELIEIVKGVRLTPGQSGPTVIPPESGGVRK